MRVVSAPDWAPKKQNAAYAVPRARRQRQERTAPERRLWTELRKTDWKVRRQAPIGRYVVDFVLHWAKLIVEVDGYHHTLEEKRARDAERDAWLALQGYSVLRFTDREVHNDLGGVLTRIEAALPPFSLDGRRVGDEGDPSAPPTSDTPALCYPISEQAEPSPSSPTPSPIEGEGARDRS